MDDPTASHSGSKTAPRHAPVAVVAVGGHAFIQKGQRGTIEEHEQNAERLCERLLTLVDRGYDLVITHGNGPQVGDLLLQQELTTSDVPKLPLDVLVAQTEGSLGYILQQALLNQLRAREIHRWVVTMVTQVLVNESDPAFQAPSKPIGPFLDEASASDRAQRLGWQVREDSGRGWRRLVPSPRPVQVIQRHMIRDTVYNGHIVLAGGGGGIPVVQDPTTRCYKGVEAVIDKDLTSAVLAKDIGADLFVILTSVPQVFVRFGTPQQRGLDAVTLREVEELTAAGEFPAGSMGPKIQGMVGFLRNGGIRGLITAPDSLNDALEGKAGTHFVGRI